MTDESTEKAAPIRYDSRALATPVKAKPPAGRPTGSGGGGRVAEDIVAASQVLLNDRGEWYQVCEGVANPGRFYDGFRGQGAEVRVAATGKTTTLKDADGKEQTVKTFNVWAMIPPGPVVPWKKGAKREKDGSASETSSAATARPPGSGGPGGNVRPLPKRS